MKWWQKEIAYQIYPKSYYDTNHDGIGDIKGITSKLDYLADLGVTMIWICPVYASPQDDNGYDISDYYNIDPMYGTMEDLDELIQKGKEKGIKLVMDLVINHTSDEHEWFKKALAGDPKYKDYYIFKKGKDGKAPTNWRSIFGGSVWEKVGEDEYYLHTFSRKQPDLNYENPELRQEIYDMINFWLDKGIAGFRVDAINHIKKDQRFQDGEVDGNDGLSTCFPFLRNVEGLDVYLDMIKKNTFDLHDCMTVSETAGADYATIDQLIGDHGAFSMMFDFTYTNIDIDNEDYFRKRNWTVKELKDMITTSQEEIQKVGWSGVFLENHDQPRSINKLIAPAYQNEIGAKALATMYLLLRGVPFIYQGQEIGMTNFKRTSLDQFDDLQARSQYQRSIEEGFSPEQALTFLNERSRDNARVPMAWDDSIYAGFSDTKPWLANEDNYEVVNVAKQFNDPYSTYSHYKQLIQLRKDNEEALVNGLYAPFEAPDNVVAYTRGDEFLVLVNLSNEIEKVDVKEYKEIVLNTHTLFQGALLPYQAIVFRKPK